VDIQGQQQLMNTFTSGSTYKREKMQTLLLHWVMMHCRPMSIIGDPELLDIVHMLNPLAMLPLWNTVTEDIKIIFLMTKAKLRVGLKVHVIFLSFDIVL
jgi:hypothetical protein